MTSYLPPIPPVVPPNAELGAEWVKRYMADQSQFRDVLRKWIVSANACCDENRERIEVLEASGGGSLPVDWGFEDSSAETFIDLGFES